MKIGSLTALCLSGALVACGGGGSGEVVVGAPPVKSPFLFWSGSSSGDRVIDANNDTFAFFADSGCLYNFQTDRENTSFCLLPGSNLVAYGPFRGQILNVRSASGACVAAVIDSFTGNFADIEVDSFGREVVLTTPLRPVLCAV